MGRGCVYEMSFEYLGYYVISSVDLGHWSGWYLARLTHYLALQRCHDPIRSVHVSDCNKWTNCRLVWYVDQWDAYFPKNFNLVKYTWCNIWYFIIFLAGGVYYMISRALGPALGGSIGLMFTVANTISVATYTIGFSESLLDFLQVFLALSIYKH